MRPTRLAPLVVAGAIAVPGCYLGTAREFSPARLDREPGWIVVRDVPVVLQKKATDCGAAALAMVLRYWKLPVTTEDVLARLRPTPGRGITPDKLRDFARSVGMKSYLVEGRLSDLAREIGRGRPVIVGTVKTVLPRPLAHYEVVVAMHRRRRLVVTLDPAHGWRQNSLRGFSSEWRPSQRVTLVFFRGSG